MSCDFVSKAWVAHCAQIEMEKRQQKEREKQWEKEHKQREEENNKQIEVELAWQEYLAEH